MLLTSWVDRINEGVLCMMETTRFVQETIGERDLTSQDSLIGKIKWRSGVFDAYWDDLRRRTRGREKLTPNFGHHIGTTTDPC